MPILANSYLHHRPHKSESKTNIISRKKFLVRVNPTWLGHFFKIKQLI